MPAGQAAQAAERTGEVKNRKPIRAWAVVDHDGNVGYVGSSRTFAEWDRRNRSDRTIVVELVERPAKRKKGASK